jgi:hypothetical protein
MRHTRSKRSRHLRKTCKSHSVPRYSGTFYSLNKWHKRLFEELGWMVLAKEKGYNDKIALYKRNLNRFVKTAEHVSSEYDGHNRKHDLNVLRMNIEALKHFVMKHL